MFVTGEKITGMHSQWEFREFEFVEGYIQVQKNTISWCHIVFFLLF